MLVVNYIQHRKLTADPLTSCVSEINLFYGQARLRDGRDKSRPYSVRRLTQTLLKPLADSHQPLNLKL